jgi:hypothetical protein
MLDGIYPEDMKRILTEEPGDTEEIRRLKTHPVRGKVFFEGTPVAQAQVIFHYIVPDKIVAEKIVPEKKVIRAGDAFVDADGSFTLSTYAPNDGAPVGTYHVTVVWRQPWVDAQGRPGPNFLPERYSKWETSELRVTVKEGNNDFSLDLKK